MADKNPSPKDIRMSLTFRAGQPAIGTGKYDASEQKETPQRSYTLNDYKWTEVANSIQNNQFSNKLILFNSEHLLPSNTRKIPDILVVTIKSFTDTIAVYGSITSIVLNLG
jgi:hypothetical protein